MKQGRVMVTETGITNPMLANKKLLERHHCITTVGLVTTPDGTTFQMAEGR